MISLAKVWTLSDVSLITLCMCLLTGRYGNPCQYHTSQNKTKPVYNGNLFIRTIFCWWSMVVSYRFDSIQTDIRHQKHQKQFLSIDHQFWIHFVLSWSSSSSRWTSMDTGGPHRAGMRQKTLPNQSSHTPRKSPCNSAIFTLKIWLRIMGGTKQLTTW